MGARTASAASPELSDRIFVVHGHDDGMKVAVARVLERLGLKPVVLHEQPDKGRTIVEKFTDYSAVGFAVVLLSPDDMAYASNKSPSAARPRARQNVTFELGYFVGKLGRENVLALVRKKDGDLEFPQITRVFCTRRS
jgi:predicted nucleotide-binding protein